MKIAVYTIALNEEKFVKPWYESAKDADYLLIADTGSTDGTVETAKSLGINVVNLSIKPWRFDDARNASLASIPADIDYCIALDMDEVLLPGWREELEKIDPKVTRPRYTYTWSWEDEEAGIPGLQYGGDKIHSRKGYRWKHPVHEVITPYVIDEVQGWTNLQIHHHPDSSKPRSQYLPLLKIAVDEDPHDDRNAFYYARELYFYGKLDEAKYEFLRHLSLPTAVWKPERAAAYRYLAKCDPDEAEFWLKKAVDEAPDRREALVDLADFYHQKKAWDQSLIYAKKALDIKEKPLEYLCEAKAWGSHPYDLAALSSFFLGDKATAINYGVEACRLDPDNQRLLTNLGFYTS